jgi:hypothetical protein
MRAGAHGGGAAPETCHQHLQLLVLLYCVCGKGCFVLLCAGTWHIVADMSETDVVCVKQRWSAGEEGGSVSQTTRAGAGGLASRGKGRGSLGGGGKLLVLLNATAILTYSG